MEGQIQLVRRDGGIYVLDVVWACIHGDAGCMVLVVIRACFCALYLQ